MAESPPKTETYWQRLLRDPEKSRWNSERVKLWISQNRERYNAHHKEAYHRRKAKQAEQGDSIPLNPLPEAFSHVGGSAHEQIPRAPSFKEITC